MRLFVDTSAWIALHDRNDQYHDKAVSKGLEIKKHRIELMTSEYIFDESITLMRFRTAHHAAVLFGESLLNSAITRIVDSTDEDRAKAWEFFKKYKDKELSFTDCTSFVLMKHLRLQKVFTLDNHFKQMGFEIF